MKHSLNVRCLNVHVVLANPMDKPSTGSQFPLTRLPNASRIKPYCSQGWKWACWNCGACKSDGRCKGTIITGRVLNICNITELPARALGRVVGVTSAAAQLRQRAAKAGRGWEEVQEHKGHREDGEGSEKQDWSLRTCELVQTLVLLMMKTVVCSRFETWINPLLSCLFFLHANTQLIFLLTCLGHTQI